MRFRAYASWIPALAWMGVIFYFSTLPGDKVPSKIPDFIPHFIEYAVLGALVVLALSLTYKTMPGTHLYGWALVICLVYAASDEFHQLFVPGRSADPKDWAVDSMGALAAILVGVYLRARRSHT